MNRFKVKSLTYYPIIIRLASLRPDSGVYTLRVIAPDICIYSQSYSYVNFKNKLIFFLCSVNDASFNVLFMKNEYSTQFGFKNNHSKLNFHGKKMYLFNVIRIEKEIVANLPMLYTPELWGKKINRQFVFSFQVSI